MVDTSFLKNANRIVVKVGTSTLTYKTGMINLRTIERLVNVISDIKNSGKEIILVSSGAVSAGFAKLGETNIDKSLEQKQAAAAVGQCELMNMYGKLFGEYGHTVAQILITKDVIDIEKRRNNAKNTFRILLEDGCIPIANENDSISFEGIKFGGNDILSAYVAILSEADLLINMSDIDGFYNKNPRKHSDAELIRYVDKLDDTVYSYADSEGSERGTGGMIAKLEAVSIVAQSKIPMVIVNGSNPEILYDVCENNFIGTLFDIK